MVISTLYIIGKEQKQSNFESLLWRRDFLCQNAGGVIAVATVLTSDWTAASLAFYRWFKNTQIAIAERIPMITITTRSSINVNPSSLSYEPTTLSHFPYDSNINRNIYRTNTRNSAKKYGKLELKQD